MSRDRYRGDLPRIIIPSPQRDESDQQPSPDDRDDEEPEEA